MSAGRSHLMRAETRCLQSSTAGVSRPRSWKTGTGKISTIRLLADRDKPVQYETMILGGKHDLWVKRCLTEEEATKQHAEAVELARSERENATPHRAGPPTPSIPKCVCLEVARHDRQVAVSWSLSEPFRRFKNVAQGKSCAYRCDSSRHRLPGMGRGLFADAPPILQ